MSRGDANAAVQATLERLVGEGREIGVQVCAYLGEEKLVDCWSGPRALSLPGMGGSIGWADLDSGLTVAFCHNRMFDTIEVGQDSRTLVGDVIRESLGLG